MREDVLFDPSRRWLTPQLQVVLLQEEGQPQVPARRDGSVASHVLGPDISWVMVDHDLRLRDDATGILLPTHEEREAGARRVAEARARRAAEEEVARLRTELERLRDV